MTSRRPESLANGPDVSGMRVGRWSCGRGTQSPNGRKKAQRIHAWSMRRGVAARHRDFDGRLRRFVPAVTERNTRGCSSEHLCSTAESDDHGRRHRDADSVGRGRRHADVSVVPGIVGRDFVARCRGDRRQLHDASVEHDAQLLGPRLERSWRAPTPRPPP